MGDVRKNFLGPLLRVFSPQRTEDVEGWMSAYEHSLRTFDDETLHAAAQRIVETRQTRTFPLPADCSIACKEAIAERAFGARRPDNRAEIRNAPFDERHPDWSERRRKQADELIQCGMGQQAAEEDWIWTLWEFCRENERLPDAHEAVRVRAKGMARSAELNQAVENVKSNADPFGLKKMRSQIVDRLRRLVSVEV
jgi:hypothetical protein